MECYRAGGGAAGCASISIAAWNASGYGEMLGVVLPPQGFADDPDKMPAGAPTRNTSRNGATIRCGIPRSCPVSRPRSRTFRSRALRPIRPEPGCRRTRRQTRSDQRPGQLSNEGLAANRLGRAWWSGGRRAARRVLRCWSAVVVLRHRDQQRAQRTFHSSGWRWRDTSPISSPGAHLSNVVLSDIISFTPDRWLNVTPAADDRRVRVAVFGVSYDESSGHHEASPAPPTTRVNHVTNQIEIVPPARVAERTVVEVWVERLDERWGEDFGWVRVSEALVTQRVPSPAVAPKTPVTIESIFGSPSALSTRLETKTLLSSADQTRLSPATIVDHIHAWQTLWEGDVTLPSLDSARHRLVIAEFEEYLVDDDQPYDRTPTQKSRRLVFVEHVELGAG